jgi:hypothetical protein
MSRKIILTGCALTRSIQKLAIMWTILTILPAIAVTNAGQSATLDFLNHHFISEAPGAGTWLEGLNNLKKIYNYEKSRQFRIDGIL